MSNNTITRALRGGIFSSIFAMLVVLFASAPAAYAAPATNAESLNEPAFSKKIINREDGSYALELSVTGDSASGSSVDNVNVIVVMDVSGSMDEKVDSSSYVPTEIDSNKKTYYGIDDDGDYFQLKVVDGKPYETYLMGGLIKKEYTGVVYEKTSSGKKTTRMKAAQNAVNHLVTELSKNNTPQNPKAVEFSLISFAKYADVEQSWTSSARIMNSRVDALEAGGGTNWEAGLRAAKKVADSSDGDPTVVVFVSDGDPTYYLTDSGKVAGEGNGGYDKCYKEAKPAAKELVDAGYEFYGIGVFGNVSRMSGLVDHAYSSSDTPTPENHYFEANDTASLDIVVETLINAISKQIAYTNVAFKDVLTGAVDIVIPKGTDAVEFEYFINGEPWNDAPAAQYNAEKHSVSWNVAQYPTKLESGITYSVQFEIEPTDEVMAIVEGHMTEEQIAQAYPHLADLVVPSATGGYAIYTNAQDSVLSYDTVTAVNGVDTDPVSAPDVELGSQKITISSPAVIGPEDSGANNTVAITKYIDGRKINPGESFDFVIEAVSEGAPLPADTTIVVKNSSDSDQAKKATAQLGKMVFWSEGVYTYTISEVVPDGAVENTIDGLTYDSAVHELEVKVVRNEAALTIESIKLDGVEQNLSGVISLDVHNVYNADGGFDTGKSADEGGFGLTKHLDGRAWADADSFEFVLAGSPGAPMPENTTATVSSQDGSLDFGTISYDESHVGTTYTYTVVESHAGETIGGVTYSDNEAVFEVAVVDNFDGTISAQVEQTSGEAVFTNTYAASGSTEVATGAQFGLTKHLDGREWADTDSFEFVLTGSEGAPMPKNTTATVAAQDGSIDFGAIAFTSEHVDKTYTYTVAESQAGKTINGVTYSDNEAVFEVSVVDNFDGTISAQVEQTSGEAVFTNTYAPSTPATVDTSSWNISKTLSGRDWKDTDSFEFVLEGSEGAPMPEATTAVVDAAHRQLSFGSISFDAQDVGNTYTYTVTETAGNIPGIVYDSHAVEITVEVVDGLDGKVVATSTISGNTEFINTYATNEFAGVCLQVSDELINHEMADGQFTFEVEPNDEASAAHLGASTFSSNAAPAGTQDVMLNAVLTKITQADAGQTLSYTITQTSVAQPGYTLDTAVSHLAEFEVADDGQGNLVVNMFLDGEQVACATADDPNQCVSVHFVNRYDASGSINSEGNAAIIAHKTLHGTNLAASQFSFDVVDSAGSVVASATNAADGSIVFPAINYALSDLVAAHTAYVDGSYRISYSVVENTEGLSDNGYTNTVGSLSITVVLTDNGDGTMSSEVIYPEGTQSLEFENTYNAQNTASVAINGTKVLNASKPGLETPNITGAYTFNIEAVTEGAPMPENATATNDAASQVSFGNIVFDASYLSDVEPAQDGSRTKVFEYSVTESGSVAGVTNDASAHSFTITLVDDGQNNLSAVASTDGALFVFTNTYSVDPIDVIPTDGNGITITKVLEGRKLVAGEFAFQLIDAQGTVVSRGTNNEAGQVVLADALHFEAPGTYTYTLVEVAGSDNVGITYDAAVYEVVAHVTNNLDGTLSVEWATDTDELVFTNTYKAAPTQIVLGASKVLDGRDLCDGEFTFELVDNQGRVLATSTNAADGTIVFDAIKLVEPGTYTFTIREVAGDDKTITYDDSEINVVVEVVDDGVGHLVARVVSEGEVVFTNTYTAPVIPPKPADKIPVTGDYVALAAAGLGIAGVAALGVSMARKKNNK